MKKILLPFDGSDSSKRALNYVIATAKETPQTEIHLLQVVDPSQLATDESFWKAGSRERLLAEGERALQPAKDSLSAAGLSYHDTVAFGSPGTEINAYANNNGCDSIVMGTRGLSAIASFVIGSVAQRVMQSAEVPVTLVK